MRLCLTLGRTLVSGGTWATKLITHHVQAGSTRRAQASVAAFKDVFKDRCGAFQLMHILDIPGGSRGDLGCPGGERWGVPSGVDTPVASLTTSGFSGSVHSPGATVGIWLWP